MEIIANCSAKPAQKSSCSSNIQLIEILTDADDPEGDFLTYIYEITGGEIIGTGAKTVWDLSGVNTGTYTITIRVDDASMGIGKTLTIEVRVIECSDCPEENQ